MRSLPALILAAAAGAAVSYFLVSPPGPVASAPLPEADATPSRSSSTAARAAAQAGIADRAAVYANAARADAASLARQARNAAAEPPSTLRTFKLGVLLARYAELDPARAIALGRELRVPADMLGTLHADWAAADPARARAALAALDDPVTATTVGLAMFKTLGGDDIAMRQIAAELPSGAERAFMVGAIAAAAETDPAAALEQALDLTESGLGGVAVQRVATAWARSDIRTALSAGDGIADPDLRATFKNAVLREWAQFDLDSVFAYYVELDVGSQEELAAIGALREIARLDPHRALDLSARLPASVRLGVEQTALASLAQRDAEAALQYVSRLPPGQQQQVVRQSLARAYGKQNPDAALAWARATGVRENLIGVLGGIAATKPQLAFEVLAAMPEADQPRATLSLVQSVMNDRSANYPALAEGLIALDTTADDPYGGRGSVGMLLGAWASRSPSAALEWTLTNAERVPPAAFSTLGANLARTDLSAAEQYLARVPTPGRTAWIQGMAQSYAQTDPSAAAAWVEQFRTDPAYPVAVAHVAQSLARLDPIAAASVLDRSRDSAMDLQTMWSAGRGVAMAWARTDAPAAAEWARRFAGDDEQRTLPLSAATEVWAGNDYASARGWALRLPAGPPRDAALGSLLLIPRGNGELDTSLLPAFSTDEVRQNAVLGAIYRVARRNPDDARRVAERHLTSPERREQAERTIAQMERERTSGPTFFASD